MLCSQSCHHLLSSCRPYTDSTSIACYINTPCTLAKPATARGTLCWTSSSVCQALLTHATYMTQGKAIEPACTCNTEQTLHVCIFICLHHKYCRSIYVLYQNSPRKSLSISLWSQLVQTYLTPLFNSFI